MIQTQHLNVSNRPHQPKTSNVQFGAMPFASQAIEEDSYEPIPVQKPPSLLKRAYETAKKTISKVFNAVLAPFRWVANVLRSLVFGKPKPSIVDNEVKAQEPNFRLKVYFSDQIPSDSHYNKELLSAFREIHEKMPSLINWLNDTGADIKVYTHPDELFAECDKAKDMHPLEALCGSEFVTNIAMNNHSEDLHGLPKKDAMDLVYEREKMNIKEWPLFATPGSLYIFQNSDNGNGLSRRALANCDHMKEMVVRALGQMMDTIVGYEDIDDKYQEAIDEAVVQDTNDALGLGESSLIDGDVAEKNEEFLRKRGLLIGSGHDMEMYNRSEYYPVDEMGTEYKDTETIFSDVSIKPSFVVAGAVLASVLGFDRFNGPKSKDNEFRMQELFPRTSEIVRHQLLPMFMEYCEAEGIE